MVHYLIYTKYERLRKFLNGLPNDVLLPIPQTLFEVRVINVYRAQAPQMECTMRHDSCYMSTDRLNMMQYEVP